MKSKTIALAVQTAALLVLASPGAWAAAGSEATERHAEPAGMLLILLGLVFLLLGMRNLCNLRDLRNKRTPAPRIRPYASMRPRKEANDAPARNSAKF